MNVEFQKQEQAYLDNIIWLWKRYEYICNQIVETKCQTKLHDLNLELEHLWKKHIVEAYDDYYAYFGKHCTYQPKLSHLA
jgi:DNA/RNA-binding domain of Phe-tRNA-synthetase-like protein